MNKHTHYQSYINALTAAKQLLDKPGFMKTYPYLCVAIQYAVGDKKVTVLDANLTRRMIMSRLDNNTTLEQFVADKVKGVTWESLRGELNTHMQAHRLEWLERMIAEFTEAVKHTPTKIETFGTLTRIELYKGRTRLLNQYGEIHNDIGAADMYDGGQIYYWRGLWHRVGGPADIHGTSKHYYLFGTKYGKRAYDKECKEKTLPDWVEYDEYQKARDDSQVI